jgi:hypothetical protein
LPRWPAPAPPEAEVIARIATLAGALLTRVGVIVRSTARLAGAKTPWSSGNCPMRIPAAGAALAAVPGVTLCYQRRTVPGVWDWPLFCMIHARTRPEAMAVLDQARALPELAGRSPHPVLDPLLSPARRHHHRGRRMTRTTLARPCPRMRWTPPTAPS